MQRKKNFSPTTVCFPRSRKRDRPTRCGGFPQVEFKLLRAFSNLNLLHRIYYGKVVVLTNFILIFPALIPLFRQLPEPPQGPDPATAAAQSLRTAAATTAAAAVAAAPA